MAKDGCRLAPTVEGGRHFACGQPALLRAGEAAITGFQKILGAFGLAGEEIPPLTMAKGSLIEVFFTKV